MQTSLPAERQHGGPMSGKEDQTLTLLQDRDNPLWELLGAAGIIQMFLVYSVFNLQGIGFKIIPKEEA